MKQIKKYLLAPGPIKFDWKQMTQPRYSYKVPNVSSDNRTIWERFSDTANAISSKIERKQSNKSTPYKNSDRFFDNPDFKGNPARFWSKLILPEKIVVNTGIPILDEIAEKALENRKPLKNRPTGRQAVMKSNVNNNKNYVVVDKKEHKMYLYKGDLILEQHEITTGQVPGDGFYKFGKDEKFEFWKTSRMTPAGNYTVKSVSSSRYLGSEPMFLLLNEGKSETRVALHSPASDERASHLNNGTLNDNNVSYGCISPALGVMLDWYKSGKLKEGSLVIVLPENEGNDIYLDKDGRIRFSMTNTPSQFTNTLNFTGKLSYTM